MSVTVKIEDRAYDFALRIVRMAQALPENYASQAIGRQVLRSGTSIGANVEEAIGAASKRDFANKMTIARKEARETHYWLRLIRDSKMIPASRIEPLILEALELAKILSKIVSTTRKNLAQPARKIVHYALCTMNWPVLYLPQPNHSQRRTKI